MQRSPRGDNLRVAAAALLLLLALLPFRELIPMRNGIGWDGAYYAGWASELSLHALLVDVRERPRNVPVTTYNVHRILEPMLIHYAMRALDVERTRENVIAAFTVANVGLLALAAYWLGLGADRLAFGRRAKWLAFVALMLNYANAKMPLYYPVLTDSAAVALGAGSLLLYLDGRTWALAAATLAGGFVWPSAPYFGLLLIAFPYRGEVATSPAPKHLALLAAALAALASLGLVGLLFAVGYEIPHTWVKPISALAPLSAALVAAYLYLGLRPLLDSGRLWADLHPARLLRSPPVWLAAATWAAGELLVRLIPRGSDRMDGLRALTDTCFTAITQPGISWVAHALYLGPLVLLLFPLWPGVSEDVRRRGSGLVLCFGLALVLGAGSESRKLMNFYPAVALFLGAAAAPIVATRARTLAALALSLAFSKLWLPMSRTLDLPGIGEVPWRSLYFSSHGPWIDHGWFLVQGLVVLAVGVWLWTWTRAPRAAT